MMRVVMGRMGLEMDGVCGGVDLCYLACPPVIGSEGEDAQTCYDRVGRSLHDVTTTTGPSVTEKMTMLDGGVAWSVTWTMVAANPIEFGVERPLVVGFLDPDVDIPYVGGVPPPDVPTVVPTCFSFPVNYRRRSIIIPREDIPLWTDVVPVISVTTKATEARSVRIWFYADMFDTGDPSSDP